MVILQECHATVPVAEGHVGPNTYISSADVGVDLSRVTWQDGLRREQEQDVK